MKSSMEILAGRIQATATRTDSRGGSPCAKPVRCQNHVGSSCGKNWNVDSASCRAQSVKCSTNLQDEGSHTGTCELRPHAVPESVALKRPQDFKLIGTGSGGYASRLRTRLSMDRLRAPA